MTQIEAVYHHLKEHGDITDNQARRKYKIVSLAPIIAKVRQRKRMKIDCVSIPVKSNPFGYKPKSKRKYVLNSEAE